MSVRSLNKVMLIGNLTRDPNLRFTPNNTAVCSFGLATNRSWTPSDGGEKQEKTEFHNIVAWGKLAEICGQILHKGDKTYLEGRLQTRDWKTAEGAERRITEIIMDDMMLLRSKNPNYGGGYQEEQSQGGMAEEMPARQDSRLPRKKTSSRVAPENESTSAESAGKVEDEVTEAEDVSEDIPF